MSPWLLALTAGASLLIGLTALFYFRKRRQVADRYTMGGEGEFAGNGSLNGIQMESEGVGRPQNA